MSEPIDQHIVPVCLLKQFSKNEKYIITEIENLGKRLMSGKINIQSKACYKIMSKDFQKNNSFKVYKNNIIHPKNKSFCERHLYSLNYLVDGQILPDEVKYFLEKHFGRFETEFGKFIKYWNDNEKNININFFMNKYKKDIINFVLSNELRGKHFYKTNAVVESKERKNNDYITFDKLFFSSFLTLNSSKIIGNLDPFERVEAINAVLQENKGFNREIKNDIIKKISVYENLDYKNNKNLLLIQNTTELSFLLSDISTSIFYNTNKNFKYILELIGKDKFENLPNKITIMPIKPNLLAIVFDSECKVNYISCNNKNEIRKFNTLFYYRNNEWLLLYDVQLKRCEIIDEAYLKKIKFSNYLSNFANWYEFSYMKESYSNIDYGYYKINNNDYSEIRIIFKLLFNINEFTNKLKENQCFNLDIKGKSIKNCADSCVIVGRCGNEGKLLMIKEGKIFNTILKFNQSQLECFEHMLKIEGHISSLYVSKEEKTIYFFKNIFFKQKDLILEQIKKLIENI